MSRFIQYEFTGNIRQSYMGQQLSCCIKAKSQPCNSRTYSPTVVSQQAKPIQGLNQNQNNLAEQSNIELHAPANPQASSSKVNQKTRTTNQSSKDPDSYVDLLRPQLNKIISSQRISSIKFKKRHFDQFTILYYLGGGGFAKVYLGYREKRGSADEKAQQTPFAIKQMKKSSIHQKKLADNILLEKQIMKTMRCNFIARSFYTFRDQEYYYIAMEWAQGGDIFSCLKSGTERKATFENLGENAIRFIIGCVVLGLQFLHSKNIVYGDMKPQNLLIFEDGYVKLSDFGLSQQLQEDGGYFIRMGTKMYFPPQVVLRSQCKRYVDLWALGVFAYQLSNFKFPFSLSSISNPRTFVDEVIKGQANRVWDNKNASPELKSFVNAFLKFEPRVRLGASGWSKIKNHSFFKKAKFDWVALEEKRMISPLMPVLNHKTQPKMIDPIKIKPEYFVLEGDDHETIDGWTSENHSRVYC